VADNSGPGKYALKAYRNPGMIGPAPEARSFLQSDRKSFGGDNSSSLVAVRLEAVGGSYANSDVNPSSVSLISPGTGSVDRIVAVSGKSGASGDLDHNGVQELPIYFRSTDIAKLLDKVVGKQSVSVRLEGSLQTSKRFCASLALSVSGADRTLAASIAPNPMNPDGVLSFRTQRDGFIRVRLFDMSGRLVRVIAETPMAPAGPQHIRSDGRTGRGTALASGLYFYQVDTVDGSTRVSITVLT
jgi:hypothetical protein